MTAWIALGGPQHLLTGSDDASRPDGYIYEGAGAKYSAVYPDGVREAQSVLRWKTDADYIVDGQKIIDGIASGKYAVGEEYAALAAGVGAAVEFLKFHISNISIEPASEGAATAREAIDMWRARDLI